MISRIAWMERLRSIRARVLGLPHAAVGLVVLLLVVVISTDSLLQGPVPAPSHSPGPDRTAAPTPPESPGPTEQPWAEVHVPAFDPPADLTPLDTNTSGVDVGSAFVLHSRTASSAAELATGLTVEPAIDLGILLDAPAGDVHLVPETPMQPGTRYRFRLTDPNGRLLGTWTYRTEHPLNIVGRVPDDRTTGVPVDTGIEVTFDQDGATDVAAHFSIQPAVAGSFRMVGRTVVFAPTQPLAAATVYRVTVSAGVSMAGSDQVLASPVSWAFETSSPTGGDRYHLAFGRPVLETSPRETPVFALDLWHDDTVARPESFPLQVYRLPTFDAARAAVERVLADPGWAAFDASDLVATDNLVRVVDIDAAPALRSWSGYVTVRLPAPLPAGWYLVVLPRDGRDRQAVLQVTDLAAWAMTSTTRTVAWIHDLATGDPVPGAVLHDPSGAAVGVAGADGLIDVATPAGLRPVPPEPEVWYSSVAASLASVEAPDGRRLIVALGAPSVTAYTPERNTTDQAWPNDRWWLLASTDRSTYRRTDTIHAWGLVRARDGGGVPARVEIRLRSAEASQETGPWLVRATPQPTSRGTWAVDLPYRDLPYGDYIVDILADGVPATSVWIGIRDIRKPAYQLTVSTDRTAVVAGDPIEVTARAGFFDGTVAPGLQLRVEAFERTTEVTTDDLGTTVFTLRSATQIQSDYDYTTIALAPKNPEEGQISGSSSVVVFPSSAWLTTTAVVDGSKVVLSGLVSHLDLAAVERQIKAEGWPQDPAGAAFGGRTVTIAVVELVPVSRQVGTDYDFIEKRVVPIYETTESRRSVGTYTTTSAADGAFALSVTVPNGDHTYEVTLTTRDDEGRVTRTMRWASKPGPRNTDAMVTRPYLDQGYTCGYTPRFVDVGDRLALTMYNGDGTPSRAGMHLFLVSARGIREAILQASPTLERTFTAADLPSLTVVAVRIGPAGYVVTNPVQVRAQPDARSITVTLGTDRPRYAPGETATVTVRTTGPDGEPVAADVVLRGVDEKLFAIGGALDVDALAALLQPVGDGLLQSATSHQLPQLFVGDGCGDTTGGGRDDFRDSVLFDLVSTDADGKASVTFGLPDDITSWHVSATAVDAELRAGDGSVLVPVGLPFFADVILAPEFLAGESPVVRVRSAGDDLVWSDRVLYTISSASLLMAPTTVYADAFDTASVSLPNLPLGSHDITIDAVVVGEPTRHDRLTRRIVVRASRLEVRSTTTVDPAAAASVGGPSFTTYVITDAGRGAFFPAVSSLAEGGGARFDRALAAQLARDLLVGAYGLDPASITAPPIDVSRWERGGIALLPYSSADLPLTALAALVAPERLDQTAARGALVTWLDDAGLTRESRIIALAGLAGLGDDVLDQLGAVDATQLSVRESLWLGLAHLASGDEAAARSLERDLLGRHGEQFGPWVRLRVGNTLAESVEATSLLALLGSGVGDPLAPSMLRYLQDTPVKTFLSDLHQVGAIRRALERLPRETAQYAWTVEGVTHEETLEPGAARTLIMTAAQRGSLRIEPRSGDLAVLATWIGAPGPDGLPASDLVSIKRTVTPAVAGRTDIVRVRLDLTFDPQAPLGCYDVTDFAPSGLAPILWAPGWDDDVSGDAGLRWWPWGVDGQRVSWCVEPLDGRRPILTYSARVVSPGTFTWEPAIVQAAVAPTIGASTPALSYTVR